jgi:hypothetical protein
MPTSDDPDTLAPLELVDDTPPWKPRSSPPSQSPQRTSLETVRPDAENSPPAGFADNFLQDRNIKWILGVGTAILLGSSLMLVSSQWSGYSAIFKELIILAYTALVFVVGRYSYERLALRRTGTVLLSLAVMLAPVACAALPMVRQSGAWLLPYLALLAVAGALTSRIGGRAFRHFLREPQPSLTFPYVILALAAGIVPLASDAGMTSLLRSPAMALVLWCVFATGTIKVNRRVFHLMEEQRRPRVFGFFPMLLLALQYFGLFAAFFAGTTPLEWIGFGAVLTAIPMLLAADAIAEVFQRRTGNLVRPLPWSITLPLIAGLALCAVGLALAASPLSVRPSFALVPTALLAAAVLGRVAQRTDKQSFVYAALALVATAYRFAPLYFAAAAKAFIASTASAIHEPKLPIAYFGFTFVPLLAALTAMSLWAERRGRPLFAEPARRFALGLSLLFLALAPTHAKALFPASLTLLVVFAAQTVLFRSRHYALPALVAAVFAAAGLPQLVTGVLEIESLKFFASPTAWVSCEIVLAGLLLWPGRAIDRSLSRLGTTSPSTASALYRPCLATSLLLVVGLAFRWTLQFFNDLTEPQIIDGLLLAAVAIAHALFAARTAQARLSGLLAFAFTNIVACAAIIDVVVNQGRLRAVDGLALATGMFFTQWLSSYFLAARPKLRISQAFAAASRYCSLVSLSSLLAVYWGIHVFQLLFVDGGELSLMTWLATIGLVAWSFDAARRERSRLAATVALFSLFAIVASGSQAIRPDSMGWIPTYWVALSALFIPVVRRVAHRRETLDPSETATPAGSSWEAVFEAASVLIPTVLLLTSFGALVFFTLPALVAGIAAPLVLCAWSAASPDTEQHSVLRLQLPLMILNWRLLGLVIPFVMPEARYLFQPDLFGSLALCLPVAFLAAMSSSAWSIAIQQPKLRALAVEPEASRFQIDAMCYLAYGLLFISLFLPSLDSKSVALAAATFGLLTTSQLFVAVRRGSVARVWKAQGLVVAAVVYFVYFGQITLGRGWAMYVVLALGYSLRFVAEFAARRPAIAVFARPFRTTGMILPAISVLLAVGRHLQIVEGFGSGMAANYRLGWNSLALFVAAMFYFREGLVLRLRRDNHGTTSARDPRYTVAAAAILNVALILLWRERRFTDPQFYMIPVGITMLLLIELLEREIPDRFRDPLRYAGALIILVSPTFQIVTGSWLHIFTLMVASVFTILAAIGFRTRALMYTGTAFLAADIAAMIARGSIDHPQLLWIAGAAFGAGILGLGAVCELKREQVQQRVRAVGAALAEWK